VQRSHDDAVKSLQPTTASGGCSAAPGVAELFPLGPMRSQQIKAQNAQIKDKEAEIQEFKQRLERLEKAIRK
jgi:hypothetical protein